MGYYGVIVDDVQSEAEQLRSLNGWDEERLAELAQARADFPHWRIWVGVSVLVYGRRLMSSPPAVKRAPTVAELRDQMKDWESTHPH